MQVWHRSRGKARGARVPVHQQHRSHPARELRVRPTYESWSATRWADQSHLIHRRRYLQTVGPIISKKFPAIKTVTSYVYDAFLLILTSSTNMIMLCNMTLPKESPYRIFCRLIIFQAAWSSTSGTARSGVTARKTQVECTWDAWILRPSWSAYWLWAASALSVISRYVRSDFGK